MPPLCNAPFTKRMLNALMLALCVSSILSLYVQICLTMLCTRGEATCFTPISPLVLQSPIMLQSCSQMHRCLRCSSICDHRCMDAQIPCTRLIFSNKQILASPGIPCRVRPCPISEMNTRPDLHRSSSCLLVTKKCLPRLSSSLSHTYLWYTCNTLMHT